MRDHSLRDSFSYPKRIILKRYDNPIHHHHRTRIIANPDHRRRNAPDQAADRDGNHNHVTASRATSCERGSDQEKTLVQRCAFILNHYTTMKKDISLSLFKYRISEYTGEKCKAKSWDEAKRWVKDHRREMKRRHDEEERNFDNFCQIFTQLEP